MENITCPGCKTVSVGGEKRVHNDERTGATYRLYQCGWCELAFWNPREIDGAYYEEEGTYAYVLFHRGALKLPKWHKWFLERFHHQAEGKKLLDIGCGNGIFLAHARQLGYEVHGIDLDARSVKVANETYGIEHAYATTLKEYVVAAKEAGLHFDVITFFEVLEHQADPSEFLADVKRLVKPGGIIAGSVPNRDRVYAEGDRKNGDDLPPHHFLWFSESALRSLFQRSFSGRDLRVYRLTYSLWEYAAWLQNMFLGRLSRAVRNLMAKTILAESKNTPVDSMGVQNSRNRFLVLDVVKAARNIIFFPLAVLTFPLYVFVNQRGWDLCFMFRSDDETER